MRKLLLLALLLYDVITLAARPGSYDYDEFDIMKHQSYMDDRRNWRKKAMMKPMNLEMSQKEWEMDRVDRRRQDFDPRYYDELEPRSIAREPGYRRQYDDADHRGPVPSDLGGGGPKSVEHQQTLNKEDEKHLGMNCERPHERYEPCFAGCASVTCDNPRDRLRPCYPFCEPGCVCVHPYVRDDRTHKCVMPDECTKGLKGIPDIGEEL